MSDLIGSTGAKPIERGVCFCVIFLGGKLCDIEFRDINLVLLDVSLSLLCNISHKFTESSYFKGNSKLYSYVCCIKKAILDS